MKDFAVRKRLRRLKGAPVESKNYYIFWRDKEGREQCSNLDTSDHVVAQSKATAFYRKRQRQEANLEPSDSEVSIAQKALAAHVDDYLAHLAERKTNSVYRADMKRHLLEGIKACGFRRLLDIKPDPLKRWLEKQRHLSDRGILNKAKHWQMFTAWAFKNDYLALNPLKTLPVPKGEGARHPRRSLTLKELEALCAVAPPYRALAYSLAFGLGLRRNEIKQLRWGYFHLDREEPILVMPAEITKNKKHQPVTLNPDYAADLQKFVGASDALVVPVVPMVETMQKDLKAAGIPYRDEYGRCVDFHALRGTFITLSRQNGAKAEWVQLSARHSTMKLTDGYTDAPVLEKLVAPFKPYVSIQKKAEEGAGKKWTAKWTAISTAEGQTVSQRVASEPKLELPPMPLNIGLRRDSAQDVAEEKMVGRTGFEPVKA